ncbi:MAG: hypothetical protein LC734_09620 [Acidobacteria bacterium]|nr:hypothetical protein [Acidobacteriota bacterium]
MASVLAAGLAGMATRQSTAVATDQYGNRADVTVTENDPNVQRNARQAAAQQAGRNATRSEILEEHAWRKHTLFKDEMRYGLVFFKKDGLTDGLVLSFEIDNVVYEIPYGSKREKADQAR